MSRLLITILLLAPFLVNAQLTVGTSTLIRVGDGSILSTDGDVLNESEGVVFGAGSGLILSGVNDQTLNTNSILSIPRLSIAGGSIKNLQGVLLISEELDLANGKISVAGNIEDNSLVVQSGARINENPESWVNGPLVIEGQGEKLFPLGAGGRYAPVILTITGNENTRTAAAAFNNDGSSSFNNLPNNITDISNSWNWQVFGSDISNINVTLPLQNEDEALATEDDLVYRVIEANNTNGTSQSLGGTEGTITAGISSVSATAASLNPNSAAEFSRTYVVGVERTTVPVIHNIITPNNDNSNDFLFIEAISVYGDDNEVILLDRWGTEVYRQKNFRNFNDTDNPYDGSFDFLAPGNYICIVEYAGQTAKQVITVLN